MGSMRVNCGFSYHCPLCPLIVNVIIQELLPLPLVGQLLSTISLPTVDDIARPIFHPPKHRSKNCHYSKGMKEFRLV